MAQNIHQSTQELAAAIRTLPRYGFRIVRDDGSPTDRAEVQRDAELAACELLGLEPTAENRGSYGVITVAGTLVRSVRLPQCAAT